MLRRPPTSITLTSDDIDAYDRARLHRLQQEQQAAAATTTENPLANPTTNTNTANSFSSSSMLPGFAGAAAANVGFEAGVGSAAAIDTGGANGGAGRNAPDDTSNGMRPSAAQERDRARMGRTREERIMGTGTSNADVGRRTGTGGGMGRG